MRIERKKNFVGVLMSRNSSRTSCEHLIFSLKLHLKTFFASRNDFAIVRAIVIIVNFSTPQHFFFIILDLFASNYRILPENP